MYHKDIKTPNLGLASMFGITQLQASRVQVGIDNANAQAPAGLTYIFGGPTDLTQGGTNIHTGPPFHMQTIGGSIEHAQNNFAVNVQGGSIELTNHIASFPPPTITQGGGIIRAGIPVKVQG